MYALSELIDSAEYQLDYCLSVPSALDILRVVIYENEIRTGSLTFISGKLQIDYTYRVYAPSDRELVDDFRDVIRTSKEKQKELLLNK
ncbi:MAG: hypothetical protein ACYTE8_02600 [Planctomycetota bacterium]|jgi:hypothetical protein